MADELEQLRGHAEALGVKVDRRWGADRLREEIAAAAEPDADDPEVDVSQQQAYRAGGYVNRGDGWVLEED